MFAKELKRGKSAASGSSTINSNPLASSNSFCFDGENLILNYLTYQYIDLTYAPLQQIVNYPADIKSKVSVCKLFLFRFLYKFLIFRKMRVGILMEQLKICVK